MHAHAARKRGVVVHVHVPAEQRSVGHDDAIPEPAVMGHVAAGHQIAAIAHRGDAVFLGGGQVDRHALPDQVAVADDHFRVFPPIRDILGRPADHDAGKDVVVLADRAAAHQRDVILEPRAAADRHPAARPRRKDRFRLPRRFRPADR